MVLGTNECADSSNWSTITHITPSLLIVFRILILNLSQFASLFPNPMDLTAFINASNTILGLLIPDFHLRPITHHHLFEPFQN